MSPSSDAVSWIRPKALHGGQVDSVVRIVAPSGHFDRERFQHGVSHLQAAGLRPVYDPSMFGQHLYLAGDDERRAGEFLTALNDPQAGAIWAARGGYGAARVLPALTVAAVRDAAKWFIGFSDATALHCLWAQAGVLSVHGANVHTLASWGESARADLLAMLQGDTPTRAWPGKPWMGTGTVRGRLLGGNLTVLASLAGTGFLPSWRDAVVFLEDVGERPYRLDRCISQLRLAGALSGARGVVVGQLTDCPADAHGVSAKDAILDALAPLRIPVVGELAVGHEAHSQALLLGAEYELDADHGALRVQPS